MNETIQGKVLPIDLEAEMRKSFISYAMAVIIDRALPDVRDGLKPVHRRILYSMLELGLQPDKPYRKSARIVGDCMGKYHPHGDSSLYMAMVRLAQDFSTRYPLVQGHGNFGSIDGDSPAAMRYTEARLSKLSVEILYDLEKSTVNFYPNFDETLMQPEVMPSRYPNLLVNGSGGIAVGMATNIPPHNLGETIDACVAMIDNPQITVDELMHYIQGPDFPTAGMIMGMSGIRESYETGRGRVVMRARAEIETLERNKSQIVVTEIPYQVNKARLVEKIAELVHQKRIDGITDLRDESGREGLRIVIELRRDVNANIILNQLYKHTQMQETFGVIMLVLVNGEPQILPLNMILKHYIDHQIDVVERRTQYELDKARARAHILEGILIALDDIDKAIHLIRASNADAEARMKLQEVLGLSEKQSQAILDMRLRRLTGLEYDKVASELKELSESIDYYISLMENRSALMNVIKEEMIDIKRRFGDERRTEILPVFDDIDIEDMIDEEDMAVTLTHFGYVKRTPSSAYRAQHRGGRGVSGTAVRDEDFVKGLFVTTTHTPIMFFTNQGRVFSLKCYQIPEAGRNAKGTPIVNVLQLQEGEYVTACFPIEEAIEDQYLVLCTKQGIIKKTPLKDFSTIRRKGLIAQNLREGDELISVLVSAGDDDLIVATNKGKCVRFDEADLRSMSRLAIGVRAIRLDAGDFVVSLEKITDEQQVLVISEWGMGKRTSGKEFRRQKRGGRGVLSMMITEKTGNVAGLHVINSDEDVMLIRNDGTIIRMSASEIREVGRNAQGVKLMQVGDGLQIVGSAITVKEEENDSQEEEVES